MTNLFIIFLAEIEFIKNVIHERINLLLHSIDEGDKKLIFPGCWRVIVFKQNFTFQCSLFFNNSFEIAKILKIIRLSACIRELLMGFTINFFFFARKKRWESIFYFKFFLKIPTRNDCKNFRNFLSWILR